MASSIDISLDSAQRVRFGGRLRFDFQSFHACLALNATTEDGDVLEQLKDDCRAAFTSRAIEAGDDDDYSSGSTFFLAADAAPRCYLEFLAQQIFRFHTQDATFDASTSGAEWWTQVIDSRDDIGWHWDRDYGLEEDQGVHVHPHLATVTYLTDTGGPTLVMNKPGSLYSHENISGPIDGDMVISRPRFAKHIKFDGRLLHAAPGDFLSGPADGEDEDDEDEDDEGEDDEGEDDNEDEEDDEEDGKEGEDEDDDEEEDEEEEDEDDDGTHPVRVTFLVNIWLNHRPVQSRPFPTDQLGQLRLAADGGPPCFGAGGGAAPAASEVPVVKALDLMGSSSSNGSSASSSGNSGGSSGGGESQERSWKFTNSDVKYRVRMSLPPPATLLSLSDMHDAFSLCLTGSGMPLPTIDYLSREGLGKFCGTCEVADRPTKRRKKG